MEEVICRLCGSPPLQAVTCETCFLDYCASCYSENNQICLGCTRQNTCTANHRLRQLIVKCQDCNKGYNIENTQVQHKVICSKAKVRCAFCSNQFLRDEIKMHMYQSHYFSVLTCYGEPVYRISRLNY
jgi:hypothetical protein